MQTFNNDRLRNKNYKEGGPLLPESSNSML